MWRLQTGQTQLTESVRPVPISGCFSVCMVLFLSSAVVGLPLLLRLLASVVVVDLEQSTRAGGGLTVRAFLVAGGLASWTEEGLGCTTPAL